MSNKFICALAVTATLVAPAFAQSEMETVVVTGARAEYNAEVIPHVTLLRRADHVITKVRVVCDTRELSKRRQELKDTLRSMIREAGNSGTISLGVGDEIVADLTEKMLDKVIEPDAKADTSVAVVIIKTRVSKDDMFDGRDGSSASFRNRAQDGANGSIRETRWDLTLIGPEQYRAELTAKIAKDAQHGGAIQQLCRTCEGLQHPIAWYQKGPLDLALYIPYVLTVAPPSH